MASASYQTVVAGRVREDEGISFYNDNKVATATGTWSSDKIGGKTQPTIDSETMHDEAMGKGTGRSPQKSAYNPNGNNIGS